MENPKVSSILTEAVVLSIICDECESTSYTILKEEESVKILTIIVFINNINE